MGDGQEYGSCLLFFVSSGVLDVGSWFVGFLQGLI
jgi:hypothetical protein